MDFDNKESAMVFDTQLWKMVASSTPLVGSEIRKLKASIANCACMIFWLTQWGEAIQKMLSRKNEEACPDYYYQKGCGER